MSKVEGIKLAAPIVEGQALASSPFNASGVLVRGMRAADIGKLRSIATNIKQGTLDGFDRGARRGDRPQARRSALAARGRQPHAGGAARRGDPDGDDAAHQVLQDRRRVRDRHVGVRHRVRVHADARGAGLFQPLRRRYRDRGLRRQSRPGRSLPQARHRRRRAADLHDRLAPAQCDVLQCACRSSATSCS